MEQSNPFEELVAGLEEQNLISRSQRPLLAHYTSISVVASILKNKEVWFSSPLFMNDLEEMRFGLNNGKEIFIEEVSSHFSGDSIAQSIIQHFSDYWDTYDRGSAMDLYVFCLGEHRPDDYDGQLSMWRAYGAQGGGAALIFSTEALEGVEESPFVFLKVQYASADVRRDWLRNKVKRWCEIASSTGLVASDTAEPVRLIFGVILLFALSWKHDGFKEEEEWRVIYLAERDGGELLNNGGAHYLIGRHGVEPKLKLTLEPKPGVTGANFTLEKLVWGIILGPSVSSALSQVSFARMLTNIGRDDFASKVHASTIPLRAD